MRLGLFGGTFDPVHAGHVAMARQAREELALDRVLLLPTAIPPHKQAQRTPALRRFVMVELALLDEPGLFAADHEMQHDRPSYAVDTLEHFRGAGPGVELYYLLGMDSLAELPTWRRWRELPGLARLVVLRRPGHRRARIVEGSPPEIRAAIESGRILLLDNPRWDLSSTEIRECLSRRETPSPEQLHPRVLDYVRRYRLYDEEPTPLELDLRR